MSVKSDKLQLWLDRYQITAQNYYDRITSKPGVRITSDFYLTIQELLTGNAGDQFIFLYYDTYPYLGRTIFRFEDGHVSEGSAIWTLPYKELGWEENDPRVRMSERILKRLQ